MKVFTRKEVAAECGIDPATVKGWSTGKPITIGPSIRNISKHGALVLYSEQDVEQFKLVAKLRQCGFSVTSAFEIARRYARGEREIILRHGTFSFRDQ